MRVTAGKRNTEGQASSPTLAEQKESRRVAAVSSSTSPFGQNEWLVEEMYRKFREDPSSVDPSWHEFLVDYSPESTTGPSNDGDNGARSAAAPTAPREPGPAPAPKPDQGNGTKTPTPAVKTEAAPDKAEAKPEAEAKPIKPKETSSKPEPAPAEKEPAPAKTDAAPAKAAATEAKPAQKSASSDNGDEAQVLRVAAAAVVKNMSAS